jgi:hypothetical protein
LRANGEPDELGRYCYWTDDNPHWMPETLRSQFPQKLNVETGIIGDRILKPVFFDGNRDGATYLMLLQEDLMPALAALFSNLLDPNLPVERIWYQQDGAPPLHYVVIVCRYLDEVFPNRWIGRRGHIEWPARAPDFTPLDFFFGHISRLRSM